MKSIDLYFLSKQNKSLSLPNIIYENITNIFNCSACYYSSKFFKEILINNKYYNCNKGLIVINTDTDFCDKNEIENTIAHEWRHHYQHLKNIYEIINNNYKWEENYDNEIINFYTKYQTEMDALLFSQKIAPTEENKYIINLIRSRL